MKKKPEKTELRQFSAYIVKQMMKADEYKAFVRAYEEMPRIRSRVDLNEKEIKAYKALHDNKITIGEYARTLGFKYISKAALHYGRVHVAMLRRVEV